jgi:hypothetical protein
MSTQYIIQDIYDYVDENNILLYQTIRYFPKKFKFRRPLNHNTFVWGISAGEYHLANNGSYYRRRKKDPPNTQYTWFNSVPRRVLYHLPNVISSEFIILVEGEKDVHTIDTLGFTGTTNSGGASSFPKDLIPYFKNKYVAILSDNDNAGKNGSIRRANLLLPYVKALKVIFSLPLVGDKGDVTNWIELLYHKPIHTLTTSEIKSAHNTLYNLIQSTPIWNNNIEQNNPLNQPINQKQHSIKPKRTVYCIEDFLSHLELTEEYEQNKWIALCPAHDDHEHSLGVSLSNKHILIHCFTGCSKNDIISAINLTDIDLFLP